MLLPRYGICHGMMDTRSFCNVQTLFNEPFLIIFGLKELNLCLGLKFSITPFPLPPFPGLLLDVEQRLCPCSRSRSAKPYWSDGQ